MHKHAPACACTPTRTHASIHVHTRSYALLFTKTSINMSTWTQYLEIDRDTWQDLDAKKCEVPLVRMRWPMPAWTDQRHIRLYCQSLDEHKALLYICAQEACACASRYGRSRFRICRRGMSVISPSQANLTRKQIPRCVSPFTCCISIAASLTSHVACHMLHAACCMPHALCRMLSAFRTSHTA